MKSSITKLVILSVSAGSLMVACKGSSGNDTEAAGGVQVKFITCNTSGPKPQMGDYARVRLTLKNAKDSVIFNSANRKDVPDSVTTIGIHLKESFKGCLADVLTMMSAGDSASFMMSADSLYYKTFQAKNMPPFVQPGSMLTCNVKLVKFETGEQAKANREKRMQEREAKDAQRKADEPNLITKYLGDNHLNIKPQKDGMYILKDEKGKGEAVKEGDSVAIKYTAMLLDGTIVEESDHGEDRTTYYISYKKDPQLPGIDDVLATMKEGETVEALFPSSLAFGAQRQGPLVEPYTPLLFSITVVDVKPGA